MRVRHRISDLFGEAENVVHDHSMWAVRFDDGSRWLYNTFDFSNTFNIVMQRTPPLPTKQWENPLETDPNGKAASDKGSKLDAGKNRMSLVLGAFAEALEQVSLVGTFGANKYTDNGWLEVPNGEERYTDALFRHWAKESKGEVFDDDSDLLHAAHLAWNSLARLTLMIKRMKQEGESIERTSPNTLEFRWKSCGETDVRPTTERERSEQPHGRVVGYCDKSPNCC